MASILQAVFSFSFLKIVEFKEIGSQVSSKQNASVGSDKGMVPIRRQQLSKPMMACG